MADRPNWDSRSEGRSSHPDEHIFLDLILGLLSPEAERETLSHLAGCPACEKRFQSWAREAEQLEATRVLRVLPDGKMVLETRDSMAGDWGRQSKPARGLVSHWWPALADLLRRPRFQLAGALVAAAVLILLAWPPPVTPPVDPDLHMLRPYSFELQQREIPVDVASEELRAGLKAYQDRDFAGAVDLLKRAESAELDTVHETIRRMYLGSALAWNRKYSESAAVLERVSFHLVPGQWGREAQWTLYVALKASGRQTSADSLLKILADRPGDVGDRARDILNP